MGPQVETFDALAARVLERPARCGPVRLVAVDGPGGAGKSTFAGALAAALAAQVVHTDDFASWDDALDWWPRLEDQVLGPLGRGAGGRYQRFDWEQRALAEWHDVPTAEALVLEGVSSARLAVSDRLTLAVWVEAPPDLRLSRGLARDGADARPLWDRWMAAEDQHYETDRTALRADLVVDGAPRVEIDTRTEYVPLVRSPPAGC